MSTPEPAERRPEAGTGRAGLWLPLAVAALAAIALLLAYALSPAQASRREVEFEVLPGWGARRIAEELEDLGVVRSGEVFSLYLRLRGLDRSIGEGLYTLDPADGVPALAASLARGGRPRVARIVVPEGFRMQDVARRLAAAELGEARGYLELMERPGDLRPAFVPPGASLEGYLFPASYELALRSTPRAVLDRFLERFRQELSDPVLERLEGAGLSVHEWVTLASLVQAEAGDESEMPVIAGVFLNRLELGMPLQSDPTVAYGLGKDLPQLDALAGDLRRDHPWNTYTRTGLPWGPINNPGREALRSVLAPQRSNEAGEALLYFLHGFDGQRTVFRPNTNLEDHNRDVERYLVTPGR